MTPGDEKLLETEIDRELKDLPELQAPRLLLARVMASVEGDPSARRRGFCWQTWPRLFQGASLVVMTLLFAAVCFAAANLARADAVRPVAHWIADGFAALGALAKAMNALGQSASALTLHGFGWGILCLAFLGIGYAFCIGVSALYVRIALIASAPPKR